MTKNDVLSETRVAALAVVHRVMRKKTSVDAAFEAVFKEYRFEKRDEAFVRLLVMTFLRHAGEADALLSRFLEKPIPEREMYVADVLRLGAIQAVYLKTPAHAVVSTAVEVLKGYKRGAFSGFANAVLRKVTAVADEVVAMADKNYPVWLKKQWETAFGSEKAAAIEAAFLQEAPLDISVKSNAESWAEKLNGIVLPTGTVRCANDGNVTQKEGFDAGEWWVQDVSAALPVRLLGNVSEAKVLDVCAAPGGKTAQLCVAGAKVTSLDVSESRLKRLRDNMRRLRLRPSIVCADFRKWTDTRLFDAVLLDAPCSATGTLRRHPDILYCRTPEDVARLSAVQEDLLERAVQKTVVGGTIVYCVCSVLPCEGKDVVDDIVSKKAAVRVPVDDSEVPAACVTADGDVLCLPDFMKEIGGCDGFYAARLKRVK